MAPVLKRFMIDFHRLHFFKRNRLSGELEFEQAAQRRHAL